ncbi:MAG: sulfatase [Alphaproteobacteria bacterium]|nr:sulfatase [Alphaproteobacteria bacterium]
MSLLLPLLLSCQSSCQAPSRPFRGPTRERPATFVDPDLTTSAASPSYQLHRLAGRFTLAPSTLPEGFEVQESFEVHLEPAGRQKKLSVWRGPSPFPEELESQARMAAPPGVHLYVGDQELRYDPNLSGRSWKIHGARLMVSWPSSEKPVARVTNAGVSAILHRRELSLSDLAPEDFVRDDATIDDRTRQGLLLPAPSRAEWDITPPPGARFRTFLAMQSLPLVSMRSDGAEVVLSVIDGGTTTEVARRPVPGVSKAFDRWDVDLSAFAGRPVTLVLSTEPGATNHFDHVFLGSPEVWGTPSGDVRHVVVIGMDTTRPDHFGFYGYDRDTTPELDEVARTSVVFDHTWTPAPRTRPSFRSAFTGRRPLDAVGAKNIAELFRDHGFATGGVAANVHLQPRFDFHHGFDDWWYDGHASAADEVNRALDWLEDHQDRDTFQFVHVMDPHMAYSAPGRFGTMFVDDPDPKMPPGFNRWDVYKWLKAGRVDDRRKAHITGLYDGELRYTSQELGRFFDQLDRMPGHNLVVLHSDHGEELFDHDQFEHNHTVYEETTRGLLWFRSGPGQTEGKRISAPATLADIAPTLFDFAGFEDAPPTDGRSLVPLLMGTEDPEASRGREIPVGLLRYDYERWAVTRDHKKYTLYTMSGQEELYDLDADPHERKNLASQVPLDPYREALARAHGMQVGRGWRIEVGAASEGETFVFRLPQPALAAEIMDPDATIPNPANEEWGEKPWRNRDDVGKLQLSDDHTTLTWTAGPKPAPGWLVVLFGTEVDPEPLVIERGDAPLVTMVSRGKVTWRAGQQKIEVVPGTVVLPPVDEATRMKLLRGEDAEVGGDEMEKLCQLGYVECDPQASDEGHRD